MSDVSDVFMCCTVCIILSMLVPSHVTGEASSTLTGTATSTTALSTTTVATPKSFLDAEGVLPKVEDNGFASAVPGSVAGGAAVAPKEVCMFFLC